MFSLKLKVHLKKYLDIIDSQLVFSASLTRRYIECCTSLKYIKLGVAASHLDKRSRLQKAATERFVITQNKSLNFKLSQYTKKNQLLPLGRTRSPHSFSEANECSVLCLMQGRGMSAGSTAGQPSSFI